MSAVATKAKPRTAGRTPVEEPRTPVRTEMPREVVPKNRAVAIGRDGKQIWRKVRDDADPYYLDPSIIPDGWTYEWKRFSVYGWEDRSYQVKLRNNGWTPVPAERHDGVFMPVGHKGPIERDGQILMERPAILTEEAQREEKYKADAQMHGARQMAGMMPQAEISFDHPDARKFTGVKATRERALIDPDRKGYSYSIDE